MVHQLISVTENISPDDTIWNIFDQKLEVALLAVEVAVSIRLRIEMGKGIELIRWLEGWNLRFKQQNRALISVVEDSGQLQCLEMSHPNLGLLYISSINEIPRILLRLTQLHIPSNQNLIDKSSTPIEKKCEQLHHTQNTDTICPDEHTAAVHNLTISEPLQIIDVNKSPLKNDIDHIPQSEPDNIPSTPPTIQSTPDTIAKSGFGFIEGKGIQIFRNTIVEISGEYTCDNCGMTRMFCKGDVVDKCENRECAFAHTSFTLQFDLF